MIDNDLNAVITDRELERGEHPIGKLVHISTVTHAFRGVLKEVTASYYILDSLEPVALVDSTGNFADYLADPQAVREGDLFKPNKKKAPPTVYILRGAVSWFTSF